MLFRYNPIKDIPYFLMLASYGFLVISMTFRLWFGDGVNIFASYSSAADPAVMLVDANYVYWSKTGFLFSTLLLYGLKFDYRFVAGVGMLFWAGSLMLMFAPTLVLMVAFLIGASLVGLQVYRGQIRDAE
jgi:hypothetical protein